MIEAAQAGAKILVVDDEASIVRLLVQTLSSAGYTNVRGLTDATEVPAYLDAEPPDLVILDLNMPGLDGFALLREISERLTEDVFLPVMTVSGMAGPDAKERAFRSGAKDFLAKPVDLQELLLHVNSLLETRFLSLRLQNTQERLADLVGVRTEELQRSVARTQEAEDALRLTEEQFRLLSQTSGVAVSFYSVDGRLLFVNDVAASLFGVAPDEVLGRHISTLMPPATADRVLERLDMVLATGERMPFENELTLPSGQTSWFLSTYAPVIDAAGQLRGVQIVSLDITDRRAAEERLQLSEELFQKAFHSNPAPSTIAGPDARVMDANAAWLAMMGFTREEVVGRTSMELGVLTKEMRALMLAAAEGGAAGDTIEILCRTKSGEKRTVLTKAEYVSIRGERCLLATGIDITERKAMEESLLLTQVSLDRAADAIFWFDSGGRLQYVNECGCRMYGYSYEEAKALTVFDFDPDLTPDRWADEWRAMKDQGTRVFTARPRKKDGRRFHAEITTSFLTHEGRQLGITFVRDVTDRHLAEKALRASEDRLSQMFSSMSSGVVVYEVVGDCADIIVQDMNPAAESIDRVDKSSCIGRSIDDVFPFLRRSGLRDVMERVWRTGGAESYPVRLYENGQMKVWAENFLYRLPSGEVVAIFDDVTEKRQALADLQDAYARLRDAQTGTLLALGSVTEFRDPYTAGHQRRVARIAARIGQILGLSEHEVEGLRAAATVHDVGKIAVPIEILSSPSQLTPVQQTLVREHVESGVEILRTIAFDWPLADIVGQHHERLDGSGYPQGLKGDEIMLEARILAVADTAEAMISHRPYRPAQGVDAALDELRGNAGTLYDSAVVAALMQLDLTVLLKEGASDSRQLNLLTGPGSDL